MHPDLQEAIDLHHAIVAEAGNALVGYATEKALANVVLLSEIPTTYDKDQKRQVNAGNLLLRGVPGVGKTFFGVILAAISNAKFARLQGRADLQPTEIVGFQMINPATGEFITEFGPAGVGRGDPARRDQPHPAEVAERVPRGPAGPHHHRRQDHLRDADLQLRHRDHEPGGAGAGHLSAVRSRHRSFCHPGEHPVSAARRGREAGQLRLQAGPAEVADVQGADHRAAWRHHAGGAPARGAGEVHPPSGRRHPPLQRRKRLAARIRRRRWSRSAWTWAARRAPPSRGDAW